MKNYTENDMATMWLENDVLFFIWKEQVSIDLSGAKKVVADRIRVQQGRPYPVLCSLKGLKNVEKEAWRYLSNEGTDMVQSLVLVATTPLERAFSKFIITKMATIDTKVFDNMDQAKWFLSSQR